jgi:hypothetical protein
MIRQAHTYLVSAMSGATLIAIAIVVFVLLVSAQVFRDWPIAALGDGNEAHISDSRAAAAPGATSATPAGANGSATAQRTATSGTGGSNDGGAGSRQTEVAEADLAPSAGPTATTSPVDSGGEAGSGGNPTASTPTQGAASSGSGQGSSASGGNSGSGTASTPTGKLTETVNDTVNQVDETVTGGALEKTGVTQVTEGGVDGVIGPESPVGKVVDGTVETVTGLLGGNR